ncbi:unnamed protein product [Rotaria sordida]|uniref:Uncharacterized protein n=1 Tax=Rotaria sordida TaxID=392033 RepID=A0A813TJN3_9BILA|nr:unnamed protein product [Rotaria sordida]CAF0813771.1 unnamed protein product [Rotaria sordida]
MLLVIYIIRYKNVRYIQSILGKQFDNLFNKTQIILQNDILCNYINILYVYSKNWLTIDQINGIQITEIRKHELLSLEYNSYSIIIVQLINQWMGCIEDIIDNLENKLIATTTFLSRKRQNLHSTFDVDLTTMAITLSSLILILLSIVCVFPFTLQHSQNDNMCKTTGSILCIKEELKIIETIAKGIARASGEIEQTIEQTKALETLNRYINIEMNYTQYNVPIPEFHNAFFRANNIDKEFLSELFYEAHNAMLFYYNSIQDLLDLKVEYAETIDQSFKKIQDNLRFEIICRYRSALNVFSQKWKLVNEAGRIKFSRQHRLAPSFIHHIHSVVIVRYLQQWMELINYVIVNLESKYF